jgi:heme exporter protein A
MLEVVNLGCVRGQRSLFSGVNLSVTPGSLVQVHGPNGSGKTSLLRIICGLMAPENGEVRWQGANIRSLGEEYFASLTYIGHRIGLKEELTSLENLRINSGLAGAELSRGQATSALAEMGLADREVLPAQLLSEGQRRRSALSRLITGNTALWVLDEVLASLDQAAVILIESLIGKHLVKGGIAIVATHQELHLSAGSFQRLDLGRLGTGVNGGSASPGSPS